MNDKTRQYMGTLQTPYGEATVRFGRYRFGGAPSICLIDRTNGQIMVMLSVNLPQHNLSLGENEFLVKTWGENESVAPVALASGLFEDTGRRVRSGLVQVPIWRWK